MFKYKNEIEYWLDEMKIKNFTINEDLTVDVNNNVDLERCWLKELPVQFGKVEGFFDCANNQLTSLKGCPYEVDGYFACHNNKLTSLEHSPKYINGDFECDYNQLTSLEHSPLRVNGDFHCLNNQLENEQLYDMDVNQIHQYYYAIKLSERLTRELPQVNQEQKLVRKMKL
ncbi:hypothetical protein SAMN05192566_0725 [Methylophilus rhizosphaerae]|uniref:Pentapeptide repeat-containing protein n=1 Tax=Methylophilus rhizosphaerae TaxID=492660 RepID=A0A1G9A7D8_9PROT|nr:hypothetical protein [Methylophilus rhizosphaerae]SDK23161.1 hypothetical protein SAMN05192566_0725 [Methylophilus rhizosphaerae]